MSPHEHSHEAHHTHHHHSHAPLEAGNRVGRAFVLGIALNIAYVAVELTAGLLADSMALISDAGHNLSDVISLVFSLVAFRLAKVRPTASFTYGYKKGTVLASLLNGCLLLVAVGVIVAESISKLRNPVPIEGGTIAWVAGVGIVVNAFTAWLFMRDRKHDLNVRGAFLHMVADTLVSVGVVVSGIVIGLTGWNIIDPLIGLAVALVILWSTWGLLHDSLRLTLDGVPAGLDPQHVRDYVMRHEPAVRDMHHIHIWAISTTENALTAHVVLDDLHDEAALKRRIKALLAEHHIGHVTLEIEQPGECTTGECDCH